jgi:hypothetical protein
LSDFVGPSGEVYQTSQQRCRQHNPRQQPNAGIGARTGDLPDRFGEHRSAAGRDRPKLILFATVRGLRFWATSRMVMCGMVNMNRLSLSLAQGRSECRRSFTKRMDESDASL